MADFRTALSALGQGKIAIGALGKQLNKLLQNTPQHAARLLTYLDEARNQGTIDDKAYATLKRQINQFRREHATETEAAKAADAEATVFDREQGSEAATDSEEITAVRGGRAAGDSRSGAMRADSEDRTSVSDEAGDDSESPTEVKGGKREMDSESPTVIPGGEDATERRRAPAGDKTQVIAEGGPTTAGVDFDISAAFGDVSSPQSISGVSGPAGTDWQAPMSSEAAIAQEMAAGSVIKHRFKLLDVLGIGGMGKVWKVVDLLKEEARDKQPLIALKLLNEDFKSHPEAFIALQRESSRQQKLAHPNIATVYDFDRIGGKGTPVFITMELMEGQPLNTYIKKVVRKQGGLPFPEAFKITKALGSALQYAHERRLVHSDFKPGNAFLCNDGTVKTLDFGIARAVKNPLAGTGETTLFDPGKLGALTPAYASLEMLEGEEPDPRDDIYALGCVAYELLTGNHPFNKLPATTARENKLVVPPVRGLNKKQNRALRRALAFRREDRCEKVQDFIEEFEGKTTWHKNPFVIGAGVLLVIGAGFIPTLIDKLHQRGLGQMVAEINASEEQAIVGKLDEIRAQEDPADRTTVSDGAKEVIQRYFTGQIARNSDTSGENYSFPAAEGVLKEVQEFYPDSLFLQEQQQLVARKKKDKLSDVFKEYFEAVQDKTKLANIRTLLSTIAQKIDPGHPLLKDARPANAYRLVAEEAIQAGDYTGALTLVNSGLQIARDDVRLVDVKTKVEKSIRIAGLRDALGAAQFAGLADYKQLENEIAELASLSNPKDSPVLDTLAGGFKKEMDKELGRLLKEGARADAEALAGNYGKLLGALQLNEELTRLKLAHLDGEQRKEAIQRIVTEDKTAIGTRLAAANPDDPAWESALSAAVRELESLMDEEPSVAAALDNYRQTIAQLYIDKANTVAQANRFDAAEDFINRAERLTPALALLQQARTTIGETKTAFEKTQRIKDLQEQFKFQTEANGVAEAEAILEKLKAELPPDDNYLTKQAPAELGDAYARLAEQGLADKAYDVALQNAERGLDFAPRSGLLENVRDEARTEVNIAQLGQTYRTARVFTEDEVVDMARKVDQIEQSNPDRFADFRRESEAILTERIGEFARTDENVAAALADAANQMFPTSSALADLKDRFQLKPWPDRDIAEATMDNGELTKAQGMLAAALEGENKGHPEVLAFQKTLEQRVVEANESYTAYEQAKATAATDYGQLRQAKKLLGRAQSFWVDNKDYDAAETALDQAISDAPNNPSKRLLAKEEAELGEDVDPSTIEWKPTTSPRECQTLFAGYGQRARAICFDLVNRGWRGPQMVVIPAGGKFEKEFAIGKYEVSVGDWSKFCAVTKKCTPELDKTKHNDPKTGVTVTEAQEYVSWLSERTGKTYRLPTVLEWEYASSQGGQLTSQSEEFKLIKGTFNCRVTLGDKILKGTGTANIKSGSSNKWGLKNFVGNVQELVVDEGGGSTARGGAYSDAITNCDLTLSRQSNGDEITGFRVLLEQTG